MATVIGFLGDSELMLRVQEDVEGVARALTTAPGRPLQAHVRGERRAGVREPGGDRVLVLRRRGENTARAAETADAAHLACTGPQKLAWQETAAPSLRSDGDALVRPIAVATCDLDAAMIAGETPFPVPIALGHEGVAEVVEVGDGCGRSLEAGQRPVPGVVRRMRGAGAGARETAARSRRPRCTASARSAASGADSLGPRAGSVGGPHAGRGCEAPGGSRAPPTTSRMPGVPSVRRWSASRVAAVLIVGGAGSGSIGLYAAGIARVLGAEGVTYVDADPRAGRPRRDSAPRP